jgi:hypothetical protein
MNSVIATVVLGCPMWRFECDAPSSASCDQHLHELGGL